jgi:hypothetical protein
MRALRLLTIAVWAALWWQGAGEAAVFSHRRHVEKEELKCRDCHASAWTSAQANDDLMPGPAACADCHDPGQVSTSFPAPARTVRFAHRHHVETLKMSCEQCHEGVSQREAPAPVAALPPMGTCMSCHNAEAAPRECETCHTQPTFQLKPASHQPGWKAGHGPEARLSDSSCLPCHRVSECQECHEGAQLSKLDSGLRQTPFAARMEGSIGQAVVAVHGLNYRFLHGLDARGKSGECATCHELEAGDFCAQCHNPGGDPGIRPVWHGGPDWVPLQGGGRHARLARQDLESCVSCHDLEGRDPTCQRCHRSGEAEEDER